MEIWKKDLASWEKRYRTNFINSLNGFKSANVLGTQNTKGQTNLAIVSSLTHLGSDPALLGYVCRPNPESRHTYDNIKASGWFTANQVHESIIWQAHQTAARYPRETSEFAATGLREEYVDGIPAPFLKEANLKIGLKLEEEHAIKSNGTFLLVASVQYVALPPEAVRDDGFISLDQIGAVAISGLDAYYRPVPLIRLAYAKPDQPVRPL